MTARYSHRRLYDLASAVEKLPRFLPAVGPEVETIRATGTYGAAPADSDKTAPQPAVAYTPLTQTPGSGGERLRLAESIGEVEGRKQPGLNPLISQGVEANCDRVIRSEARAGDGARTHDSHVGNVASPGRNPNNSNTSGDAAADVAPRVAPSLADPDLRRVVAAWPDLPEAIRRAVLALVGSANA